MKSPASNKRQQRGAVAIMVALTLCLLIGLLGIVIDLAHLGIRKTELQNAADAAALAGVRQLDGKASGIDAAVLAAQTIAAANASDFGGTPVSIGEGQISFGTTPDGPWASLGVARANPGNIGFVKVDTRGIDQETRATWFAPLLAFFSPDMAPALASTTANGVAVAGAALCEGVPLFICPPAGGFVPGRSYFFADKPGEAIGPGNLGYFDPVPPGGDPLISGADDMRDVICAGKTYCLNGGTYISRTQNAFGSMARAFNSRFDDYGSLPSKLSPEICRPDNNVKEYPYSEVAWMTPAATQQGDLNGTTGVRWSAVVPPDGAAGQYDPARYPALGSPYRQTAGDDFYRAPSGASKAFAQANRRILTMGIGAASACDGSVNGTGKPVPIAAFGRFFLQIKAVGTGSNKGIYVEYIETLDRQLPNAPDIKLYR